MTQLAKVTKGMLCFGERRQRRSGLVYLADGKTECQDVRCEEGMIVKVNYWLSLNFFAVNELLCLCIYYDYLFDVYRIVSLMSRSQFITTSTMIISLLIYISLLCVI